MAKLKTTVYLEADLWRAAKVEAARTGRRDYQVLEEALRCYLGQAAVEAMWQRADLNEADALALAYDEIHAARQS